MARKTPCLAVGVALFGFLYFPSPASAQLAPAGGTFLVTPGGVRGSSSAYDSSSNLFLAVGAYGPVNGRLVRPDGTFASEPFRIDSGVGFAHYPAVAYGPQVDGGRGGYLVTWHQDTGNGFNLVRARLVSATGGLLGSELTLGNEKTWWETAPNVAYSAFSQMFLVTWRIGAYQIRASRVTATGQNLDAAANPANGVVGLMVSSSGGEQDPAVGYNPETGNFLIAYSDFVGGCHVYARLVTPSGAVGAAQLLGASTATYLTDVSFSTSAHKYLVGWFQNPGATTARFVNPDGTAAGNPFPVSSRFGTYDSLGMAFNPVTGTTLLVGQDAFTSDNGGVEISDNGPGTGVGLTSAPSTPGNFYPRVSSSTLEGRWMLTTAHNFTSVIAQFATSAPTIRAPAITANPAPVVIARAGGGAVFTASAIGGPMPSVQWQVRPPGSGSFIDIPGGTGTTLAFVVVRSQSGSLIRAHFTNASGEVFSTASTLIVAPGPLNDIDGDGRSDALVWRPGTGTWFWLGATSSSSKQWGTAGDVSLTGDIDGDGMADLVIWRPSIGTWFWLTSSTGYAYGSAGRIQWGAQGDVPMLADVDGDGKSDLVVWRAATGTWYWLTSSTGYAYASAGAIQWGAPGDSPLTGDFDGDGKADLAVWRPFNGVFFWLTSTSGYSYGAAGVKQWGFGPLGDTPFIGDFDGDHRADLVIWRPANGTWYWLTSSSGYDYAAQGQKQWGSAALGDVPMLTDVDGDGLSDLEVWRSMTGDWLWLNSSGGYSYATQGQMKFGLGGDVPIVR